jgi:multiple sugar transport system substrate-binding protein
MFKKGQNGIERAGFFPSEPGWWNWGWGLAFGGRLWDGKGRLTANDPENVKALEWIRRFSIKYGASELQSFKSGFGNFSSPQNAFISQKVAMELQGVWMHNFIEKFAKDLEWGAAPFPYPKDRPDMANSTFVDNDILVIPKGARHPDEAFEFIAYVMSQPAMEKLCLGQRKQSALAKVSDAFWKEHPNPYIKLFADLAHSKNTLTPPPLGIWSEYESELNNAYQEVALLKKTPQEALDAVQARMGPKAEQYLKRLALRERAQ